LAWTKIKGSYKPKNKGKEIIWNNSFLKIGGKTFFDKIWFDRGITFIEHILQYMIVGKKIFMILENLSIYTIYHLQTFYTIIQLCRVYQKNGKTC
jgi:hypothetical protein